MEEVRERIRRKGGGIISGTQLPYHQITVEIIKIMQKCGNVRHCETHLQYLDSDYSPKALCSTLDH